MENAITRYNAEKFADMKKFPVTDRIWQYLNQHDNIIRMETATELDRPALEPLTERLLTEFGETIRPDRYKQMIGHMAKQVMAHRGYGILQKSIKVRKDGLFSYASKYCK